ncbi:MAG: hypothetical protein QNK33_04990 [Bacteroidales bacterium]|nr:hypothetical protein [Bacteroidales bacterium]
MEDLYFNLAKEEFSKGRKILLWFMAIATTIVTLVIVYLKYIKHDTNATIGLAITLTLITIFFYMIAILSTIKKKEHFFKVDNNTISYHYGLMFQSHHTYNWNEVKKLYVPPHSKNITLLLKNGNIVGINLTWIEKNKSRMIRKHIFYSAKTKGIEIHKSNYKK